MWAHFFEVRSPNSTRSRITGWERTASERTYNKRKVHENPVTRSGGEHEPLRNAPTGMLTGTTFPCSSLNGGPSFVPE